MTTTRENFQTTFNKLGNKIQSMVDISYSNICSLNNFISILSDFPESEKTIKALEDNRIRREVEVEHYEKLQELAKMCNEFFAK